MCTRRAAATRAFTASQRRQASTKCADGAHRGAIVPPPRRDKSSAVAGAQATAGPSRPSFRPRPIDLAKPLPIIKSSKDLRNEDDVVVNRALPTIATGVDPSEEEERHLQQALLASVFGKGDGPPDIPVPVFSAVKPPAYSNFFAPTDDYLIFDRSDADLIDEVVEYDADHEDNAFAKTNNLDVAVVEVTMDTLEKLQAHADTLSQWSAAKTPIAEAFPKLSEMMHKKLFNHWHKRREDNKRPFLRIFQPPPDPNDTDPSVAFRPRDKEAGAAVAQRMNTYDNFRRATVLRNQLVQLRDLLDQVKKREQIKAHMLSMRLLMQRAAVTAGGGPRIDSIVRAVFPGDSEPVIVYGNASSPVPITPGPTMAIVPCRGLDLPDTIHVETRRLSEKPTKKMRRKSQKQDRRQSKDFLGSNIPPERSVSPGAQHGVDTFGFDEHGNRFLKAMRYFAGGFMNYGVSPYDHRVFAAASERNTVRALPREPQAVSFPSPAIHFARPLKLHSSGEKVGHRRMPTRHIDPEVGHTSDLTQSGSGEPALKKQRQIFRVRGRVGRGGRILFDRVAYERERGVKAASYPSSVEIGGVYTGDVPLDAAARVSEHVKTGFLGEIHKLALPEDDDDSDKDESLSAGRLTRKLAAPLKPMVEIASPGEGDTDVVRYWPHQRRYSRGGKYRPPPRSVPTVKGSPSAAAVGSGNTVDVVSAKDLRKLPAYAPRNESPITEL